MCRASKNVRACTLVLTRPWAAASTSFMMRSISDANRLENRAMPKPKPEDEADAIDLEQDRGTRPAEPVETDSNDDAAADANGDSDDERPDENQAVPDRA